MNNLPWMIFLYWIPMGILTVLLILSLTLNAIILPRIIIRNKKIIAQAKKDAFDVYSHHGEKIMEMNILEYLSRNLTPSVREEFITDPIYISTLKKELETFHRGHLWEKVEKF